MNTELLLCMACMSPTDSFSAFDKRKLIQVAEFYKSDFSPIELVTLDSNLRIIFLMFAPAGNYLKLKGLVSLLKNGSVEEG